MADGINAFKNNLDAHLDEHPIKYDYRAAMSNTDIEEWRAIRRGHSLACEFVNGIIIIIGHQEIP